MEELPFPFAQNNQKLVNNILSFDKSVYYENLNRFNERTGVYEPGDSTKQICKKIIEHLNK
jgi:CDP-glycerol glycerophosphotransferase